MDIIPKKTLKMLRKLKALEPFDLLPKHLEDIIILHELDLIKLHQELDINDLIKNPNSFNYIAISPKGRIYLTSLKNNKYRFWIPTAISIIALINSFKYEIIGLLRVIMRNE